MKFSHYQEALLYVVISMDKTLRMVKNRFYYTKVYTILHHAS